jgi:hypothetical protein
MSVLLANPEVSETENDSLFADGIVQKLSFAFQLARECLDRTAVNSKRYHDS